MRKFYIHRIYTHVHPEFISFQARGMDTVPLTLLLLLRCTLTSVRSSTCSSLFFSFKLLINLRVISSHSSGSSIRRNPIQMMMVAARRTTLKITSCFRRSTAREGEDHTSQTSQLFMSLSEKQDCVSRLTNTVIIPITLYAPFPFLCCKSHLPFKALLTGRVIGLRNLLSFLSKHLLYQGSMHSFVFKYTGSLLFCFVFNDSNLLFS